MASLREKVSFKSATALPPMAASDFVNESQHIARVLQGRAVTALHREAVLAPPFMAGCDCIRRKMQRAAFMGLLAARA